MAAQIPPSPPLEPRRTNAAPPARKTVAPPAGKTAAAPARKTAAPPARKIAAPPPRQPSGSGRDIAGRDGFWLGIALAMVAVALVGLWQTPERINHDCALYLQQADLLLDGAVPYRDFVDTNPPLIIYLNVPPAALARTLGLSPIIVFHALVLALLVISGLEVHFLLRQRRMSLPAAGRGLVLLAWIAAYFVIDWRGDTGQREHLFMLLYVPYLFLRILRYRGGSVANRLAILLGLQAGLGASLKPHFLLLAVNVEIVLLLATFRRRTLLRPENLVLVGVVAAYLLHWLVVPAAMREAFFGRWLPLIRYGYSAYNVSFREVAATVLSSPISLAGLAAAFTAMLLCGQRLVRLHHHLVALAALLDMALVLIFLQQKGWSYHSIPLDVAGLLCLALLAVEGDRLLAGGRVRRTIGYGHWAAGALLVGVLVAVWFTERTRNPLEPPAFAALRQIVLQHSQPDDRVLVVATSTQPAYPLLVQTGRRPGSRYLCSFPIAFFYARTKPAKGGAAIYRRGDNAPAEEQQFLAELADDVARRQPRLIVVQDSPGWLGLPARFNTFEYLAQVGWVEKALAPYRELRGPEGWKVFARKQ